MHLSIAVAIIDVKQNEYCKQYLITKKYNRKMKGKELFYQFEQELECAPVNHEYNKKNIGKGCKAKLKKEKYTIL